MNDILSPHALIVAAIVVLVAFRLYRRVRRLIGRQPVVAWRLVFTSTMFPVIATLVALPNLRSAPLMEGLVAGAVVGIVLGFVGLRLTRFESTPEGRFYTPNMVLGVAIALLFVGRLIYRFGSLWLATGQFDATTMQSFGRSALTLASFGLVAAYYTTYSLGVLAWAHKSMAAAKHVDRRGGETPYA